MQRKDSTARGRPQESVRHRPYDTTKILRTPAEKRGRHREIANHYESRSPGSWSLEGQRVAELNRFFSYRYGGPDLSSDYVLPDDDGARDDAQIMFAAYAACPVRGVGIRLSWLRDHAPWADEQLREAAAAATARDWKPGTWGRKIGLRQAERQRLDIRTIAAADVSQEQRRRMAKERDRLRKQAQRRAAGAMPRAEYLAKNTASRMEPWKAVGISKATYHRRRKDETGPSVI
jgi:hypothetical protein